MRIDDDGPSGRHGPDGRQPLGHVVVVPTPSIDVPPPAITATVAAVVVRERFDARGRQVIADMLVAPGVLAEPVHEQQSGPRIVGPPVPREQGEAIGGVRATRDGRHDAARMHDDGRRGWVGRDR